MDSKRDRIGGNCSFPAGLAGIWIAVNELHDSEHESMRSTAAGGNGLVGHDCFQSPFCLFSDSGFEVVGSQGDFGWPENRSNLWSPARVEHGLVVLVHDNNVQ